MVPAVRRTLSPGESNVDQLDLRGGVVSSTSPDRGELQLLPAKRLTVIKAIQRQPTPARVRQFRGDKWDDHKTGILSVARITDGEYAGRLHIVDGGTRWAAKMEDGDENFVFPCYVRDMTQKEAAQAFLAFNKDSMKPSAFARYQVGVRAGETSALAMKQAFERVPVQPHPSQSSFGNGDGAGDFSAIAAAERIVTTAYKAEGDWDQASDLLEWTIKMGRRAYPQYGHPGTAFGHDADIIQAIARIGTLNPVVIGDEERERNLAKGINTWMGEGERNTKLFKTNQPMEPSHWKVALVEATKNHGGSSSRGQQLAKLLVTNHNRKLKPQLKQLPD
jgi:hypothetical protein